MTTTIDSFVNKLNINIYVKYAIIFFVAAAIPTIYIFGTNHIWEDFFITFKHSKNFADGLGLVYTPGERVHGFTSPINTILLSATYLITGSESYEGALALYRGISVFVYASGITLFFFLLNKHTKLDLTVKLFLFLFLALEIKSIVYASNGQEAAFLLFFTLLLAMYIRYESHRWILIGALCAGLQYTRPDGVIYFGSIIIANFIFTQDKRSFALQLVPKYALVCTILYLPWFISMWLYYGSPIPNTVLAKAAYANYSSFNIFEHATEYLRNIPYVLSFVLLPINAQFGGWATIYYAAPFTIGLFSFLYWIAPSKNSLARYFSFSFFLMCLYLAYAKTNAGIFAWYLPPAALTAYITFCLGISNILFNLNLKHSLKSVSQYTIFILVLLTSVNLYLETMTQMKYQQMLVENGNRKEIGLWLANNTKENDTIFLEPLGYIGYFSGRKMLDYPGLVSPEITRLIKKYGSGQLDKIISDIKPDWLVLRPHEALILASSKRNYKLVKTFNQKEKIITVGKLADINGIGYLLFDAEFHIYKKTGS